MPHSLRTLFAALTTAALMLPTTLLAEPDATAEPIPMEMSFQSLPVPVTPVQTDQGVNTQSEPIRVQLRVIEPLKAHLLPDGRIVMSHEDTLEHMPELREEPK